jgi:hypothetical protein
MKVRRSEIARISRGTLNTSGHELAIESFVAEEVTEYVSIGRPGSSREMRAAKRIEGKFETDEDVSVLFNEAEKLTSPREPQCATVRGIQNEVALEKFVTYEFEVNSHVDAPVTVKYAATDSETNYIGKTM